MLAVALAFVALALPDGGYSLELRSALACAVWAAVLIGLVTGTLPRAPVPREALVAGCALAGLALLAALSLSWGADDGAGFDELALISAYLGLFTLVTCISGAGSARIWLAGLALGIFVVGALALGSRLVPALPGDDKEIAELLPAARGRLSYPIGNWNLLASVAALGVVLLAWLSGEGAGRRVRALATAGIPALALVIYLTSARGGVAVAALGAALLVALSARREQVLGSLLAAGAGAGLLVLIAKGRGDLVDGLSTGTAESQGRQVLLATLALCGAVGALRYWADDWLERMRLSPGAARAALAGLAVAGAAALILVHPLQRFDDFKAPPAEGGELDSGFVTSHFASASGSGRYQFWSVAADAFSDQPLHGIGAGGYEHYWTEHATIARSIRDAHSLYLEKLAELGLAGLGLVLAFFVTGIVAAVRRWSEASRSEIAACLSLLGAGALSAGIDVTWEVPAAFAPVVLAVAVLAGPAIGARSGSGAAVDERGRAFAGYGWGVAVLVAGWIALMVSADSFLAQRSLAGSRAAVDRSDYRDAADRAQDAIALQPWAGEPRLQLALVREASGDLAGARRDIVEATDRAPRDWRPWLARARIEARSGDVEAAREALRQARSLNPKAPFLSGAPGAQASP